MALKNRRPAAGAGPDSFEQESLLHYSEEGLDADNKGEEHLVGPGDERPSQGGYWLTRIVLLRALSGIYFVAFLVALHQNEGLIGQRGLTPFRPSITNHLAGGNEGFRDRWHAFLLRPTLLWFVEPSDANLAAISVVGLALSAGVFLWGAANSWIMAVLWLLYQSIVNVGGLWYGFGWESQLLETGFLAIWMTPFFSLSRFPKHCPTPLVVIWGYRWLIFRIMIGAGMIKIRGDQCWRDLTCMNYHYETQPVPGPLSREFHLAPHWWHAFETLANHFVELIAPWLIFAPRAYRIVGGYMQVLFQMVLISSGNLSFLNWLTIIPALSCFDDLSLAWLFSFPTQNRARDAESSWRRSRLSLYIALRGALQIILASVLIYLSQPVVLNLMSSGQAMNTSFDSFRIVNTYGAFGSITKIRTEIVLEGTMDNPNNSTADWREFNFKCKPGALDRRPCLITPYHYRLDWLMWFAAFSSYQQHPWILMLATKLMQGDYVAYGLLAEGPFSSTNPPAAIRAAHYTYKYSGRGSKEARGGQWFIRRRKRDDYFPPVTLEHPVIVRNFLTNNQ